MARLKLAGYFAAPADSATCRPGRRLLRSVHRKLALRRPQAHRNNQLKSVLLGGLQSASQSLSILIRFSRPAKCSHPRQHRAPSVCSSLLFSTLFYFILLYSILCDVIGRQSRRRPDSGFSIRTQVSQCLSMLWSAATVIPFAEPFGSQAIERRPLPGSSASSRAVSVLSIGDPPLGSRAGPSSGAGWPGCFVSSG